MKQRMFQSHPKNTVPTPLGPVEVTITNDRHAFCEGELQVRGEPIRMTLHYYLADGRWTDNPPDGSVKWFDGKRVSKPLGANDWTATQARVVREQALPAIASFLDAQPDLLEQARQREANNELIDIEGKLKKARREVAELLERQVGLEQYEAVRDVPLTDGQLSVFLSEFEASVRRTYERCLASGGVNDSLCEADNHTLATIAVKVTADDKRIHSAEAKRLYKNMSHLV